MKKENRTDLTATLELVSRDQPEQKLYITKNPESLVWELDHAETEPWKEPPDPILEAVAKLATAQAPCWEGSPTELVTKDYLAKAEHFRSLWHQKLQEEHEMKARIRELKQARKEQEKTYKAREWER